MRRFRLNGKGPRGPNFAPASSSNEFSGAFDGQSRDFCFKTAPADRLCPFVSHGGAVGSGDDGPNAGAPWGSAYPYSPGWKLARQDIVKVITRGIAQGDKLVPGSIPGHGLTKGPGDDGSVSRPTEGQDSTGVAL